MPKRSASSNGKWTDSGGPITRAITVKHPPLKGGGLVAKYRLATENGHKGKRETSLLKVRLRAA